MVQEAYYPYLSPSGLTADTLKSDATSGNALLFTAQEVAVVIQNSEFSTDYLVKKLFCIDQECCVEGGLYRRGRNWSDQEGPDDYIGLGYIFQFLPEMAEEILEYGQTHKYKGIFKYYYCNEEAMQGKIEPWLGRFPALIAHLKWAAGKKPNIFERLWWCCSVAFSGSDKNLDEWILNWLMTKTVCDGAYPEGLAIKIWRWRLERTWGSMKNVFNMYFADKNHPTIVYNKE